MERNDTRLNAKAQEKQHKRGGLPPARQLRRGPVEAREFGAATGLDQEAKPRSRHPASMCAMMT